MKPEEVEYVRRRLQRAGETLTDARVMLENGSLYGAVNRTYYACFYAVAALLYTDGDYLSKHSAVISFFDRKWIKSGRLPVEMSKVYHLLFDNRQRGDYGDLVVFERPQVEQWLAEAERFVEKATAKAEQIISESQEDETPC